MLTLLLALGCAASADPLLDTSADPCMGRCYDIATVCAMTDYDSCIDACQIATDSAWTECIDIRWNGTPDYDSCQVMVTACGVEPCDPSSDLSGACDE